MYKSQFSITNHEKFKQQAYNYTKPIVFYVDRYVSHKNVNIK